MKPRIVVLCALFAGLTATARPQFQSPAPAPPPGSFTLQCQPTLVSYKFSATQAEMAYFCQTNAAINGVAIREMSASQVSQATSSNGTSTEFWGVIVGTLANGSEVFFNYQGSSHMVSSTSFSGTMAYKIVGGTGSVSGITGSGNCNIAGTTGRGDVDSCAGTYALR